MSNLHERIVEKDKDGKITAGVFLPIPKAIARHFPNKAHEDDSAPHITLLFVGDITAEQQKKLVYRVKKVMRYVKPFRVDMGEYGEFHNAKGQKIPHMKPTATHPHGLAALHVALWRAAEDAGIPIAHNYAHAYGDQPPGKADATAFKSHATLDYLDGDGDYTGPKPTGSWDVDEVEVWGHDKVKIPLGGSVTEEVDWLAEDTKTLPPNAAEFLDKKLPSILKKRLGLEMKLSPGHKSYSSKSGYTAYLLPTGKTKLPYGRLYTFTVSSLGGNRWAVKLSPKNEPTTLIAASKGKRTVNDALKDIKLLMKGNVQDGYQGSFSKGDRVKGFLNGNPFVGTITGGSGGGLHIKFDTPVAGLGGKSDMRDGAFIPRYRVGGQYNYGTKSGKYPTYISDKLSEDSSLYARIVAEDHPCDGRKLRQPWRTPGEARKFAVCVQKNGKRKVVRFGDPAMEIKRDDPKRRKNFRARHNCDTPGPDDKPRYWSCQGTWHPKKSVSDVVREARETAARTKAACGKPLSVSEWAGQGYPHHVLVDLDEDYSFMTCPDGDRCTHRESADFPSKYPSVASPSNRSGMGTAPDRDTRPETEAGEEEQARDAVLKVKALRGKLRNR